MKNNCSGKDGKDMIVRVPVGTVVRIATDDHDNSEPETQLRNSSFSKIPLAELQTPKQRVVLAAGTAGGKGNAAFTSSTNRSPREATHGMEPQAVTALLELKLLAHVGLVGMPNAGASDCLSLISILH
jgi:GTP-binding protein